MREVSETNRYRKDRSLPISSRLPLLRSWTLRDRRATMEIGDRKEIQALFVAIMIDFHLLYIGGEKEPEGKRNMRPTARDDH